MRPYRARVVRNGWCNYEVQYRYRWWPFWVSAGSSAVYSSESWAQVHAWKAVQAGEVMREYKRGDIEHIDKEN